MKPDVTVDAWYPFTYTLPRFHCTYSEVQIEHTAWLVNDVFLDATKLTSEQYAGLEFTFTVQEHVVCNAPWWMLDRLQMLARLAELQHRVAAMEKHLLANDPMKAFVPDAPVATIPKLYISPGEKWGVATSDGRVLTSEFEMVFSGYRRTRIY